MKKKNSVIIVIIFLLVAIALLALVLSRKNTKEDTPAASEVYRLVVGDSVHEYSNNIWSKVDKDNYGKEEYNIYVNNKYFGYYYLYYIKAWNIFDSEDNYVNYNGSILAFSNNFNIKVSNYNINNITNTEIEEAKALGIDINLSELDINELVYIDLDNNGVLDKIVNVSNIDYTSDYSNYYDLTYVVLNGEVIEIMNKKIEAKDYLISPVYRINNIININDEGNKSIILRESYFSLAGETCYNLYRNNDNKYENVW